jgi:hypothetical protein
VARSQLRRDKESVTLSYECSTVCLTKGLKAVEEDFLEEKGVHSRITDEEEKLKLDRQMDNEERILGGKQKDITP